MNLNLKDAAWLIVDSAEAMTPETGNVNTDGVAVQTAALAEMQNRAERLDITGADLLTLKAYVLQELRRRYPVETFPNS